MVEPSSTPGTTVGATPTPGMMAATPADSATTLALLVGLMKPLMGLLSTVRSLNVVGKQFSDLYEVFASADIKNSCGEAGHMARQCPSAPEGSGNDGKCFNCGEEGWGLLSYLVKFLS